jgi:hypothetical protein
VAFQQSDGDGFGISNTDLIGALPRLFNADPLVTPHGPSSRFLPILPIAHLQYRYTNNSLLSLMRMDPAEFLI